jgi:hypothetical protein
MYGNDHDHRGEYASERHDHDYDYAEKHHNHYDLEREIEGLRHDLNQLRSEFYARVSDD